MYGRPRGWIRLAQRLEEDRVDGAEKGAGSASRSKEQHRRAECPPGLHRTGVPCSSGASQRWREIILGEVV